jgi:autotransporter-associated beta strand protein
MAWTAQNALAQYTFVQDTDNSGAWDDPAMWTGGPAGTFPNAVGATVLINAPTTTAPLVGNVSTYSLAMPAANITVGELTIDNTNWTNTGRSNFTNGGNDFRLIFENTSGPARYTETIGSSPGATNSQYRFQGKILLNSDLIIDQDNYPNLNTGTIFANLVEGAADKTITKDGHGGIQLEYNHLPTEAPFEGQVIINQGGIRLISVNPFSNVSGVTVNSGGQLMLADNAPNSQNFDWNFAPAAVLNLNGAGKATDSPQSVINPEGALRITNAQVTTTNFNNPVVLQSDSTISVSVAALTATLTNTVSGSGGLTKHGTGTLMLSNTANDYDGDTEILAGAGTLSIAGPFLNDLADVYLNTGGVFDLNFSGTDTIRSLYVDGVAQAPGTYGSADLGGSLITGSGTLTVTTLPGLLGDYNGDNVVDAADYVVWRKDPANNGGDPGGYEVWAANFGNTNPGAGNGGSLAAQNAAVPEPHSCLLVLLAVAWGVTRRRK